MALYNIEIIERPANPKALALIASLAQIHANEVKRRLHRIPMIVQAAIQLSNAVSIQRQLSRFGVQTRIYRSDVSIEDSFPNAAPPTKPAVETEEIIEIPDAEVTILEPAAGPAPRIEVHRRHPGDSWVRRHYIFLLAAALLLLTAGYFVYSFRQAARLEDDLSATLEEWKRTLRDQDLLLDRGITAESIARKLAEIERKLETLWQLQKSKALTDASQAEFAKSREQTHGEMLDLNFRRGLEETAVPINPTCSLDQGHVRGYSNLPDGTRLRIRLFGDPGVESVSYSTQVQDRVFQLVMDPSIVGNVYDARATVAPYTQQPPQVQEWAQMVFHLQPEVSRPHDSGPAAQVDRRRDHQPSPDGRSLDAAAPLAARLPDDLEQLSAAPDSQIAQVIANSLDQWEKTAQSARQDFDAGEAASLEAIYQRLLNLEARIDLMIELLQSPDQRDSCNWRRNQMYGEYRELRHDLQQRHQDFLSLRSPGYLESLLQRAFRDSTVGQIQVIVFDSPRREGAFTIEIESGESVVRRKYLWPLMARIIAQETAQSPLEVDAVRFRDAAGTLLWPLDQVQEAALALEKPDAAATCLDILKSPRPLPGTP